MVLPSKAFNQNTHLCLTTFMKRLNRCSTYIYSIFSWNILYKDQICFPPKLFTYSGVPSSKDKLFTGKEIEHPMRLCFYLAFRKQFNLILLYILKHSKWWSKMAKTVFGQISNSYTSSSRSCWTTWMVFQATLLQIAKYVEIHTFVLLLVFNFLSVLFFYVFFQTMIHSFCPCCKFLFFMLNFWCQAYSYIPYEGQVEAVPIYSLYFPIPAACGTFMGILGLCGDL